MSDVPTTVAGRSLLLLQINDAVYRDVVYRLHKELPPANTDDPELINQIIEAAIADIASMLPANGDEARTAVRCVIADARADECARHARTLINDYAGAMKCLAQADHFTRTANAARALLARIQTTRRKHEADRANCEKDAWTEEALVSFMAEAHRNKMTAKLPPSEKNHLASYTEAERYAILHPNRAAEIRSHGGVPPGATYQPPSPKLVEEIVASTSGILSQIDAQFAHALAA